MTKKHVNKACKNKEINYYVNSVRLITSIYELC